VNDFPASININTKNVITYRSAKKFIPKGPTPINQIGDSGARDQGRVCSHITTERTDKCFSKHSQV
jgi:hypothetical protein